MHVQHHGIRGRAPPADQDAAAPGCQQDAERAAGRGQQKAFRQQLACETHPAGAQREADGDLLLAAGGARQQEVRDVGAGDQQDQAHDGHEDVERLGVGIAQLAGAAASGVQLQLLVELIAALLGGEAGHLVAVQHLVEYYADIGLGLLQGDAGLEAAHHLQPHDAHDGALVVVEPFAAGLDVGLHHHRDPQVGGIAHGFAEEAGRSDADDLERSLAEGDDFPEHVGAAREAAVPKAVADDGVGRVVRDAVVGLGEDAADDGLHAQDVEVGAADQAGVHVLGGAAIDRGADAIGVALRGTHIGEDLLSVADVLVLAIAEQGAGGALGPRWRLRWLRDR